MHWWWEVSSFSYYFFLSICYSVLLYFFKIMSYLLYILRKKPLSFCVISTEIQYSCWYAIDLFWVKGAKSISFLCSFLDWFVCSLDLHYFRFFTLHFLESKVWVLEGRNLFGRNANKLVWDKGFCKEYKVFRFQNAEKLFQPTNY